MSGRNGSYKNLGRDGPGSNLSSDSCPQKDENKVPESFLIEKSQLCFSKFSANVNQLILRARNSLIAIKWWELLSIKVTVFHLMVRNNNNNIINNNKNSKTKSERGFKNETRNIISIFKNIYSASSWRHQVLKILCVYNDITHYIALCDRRTTISTKQHKHG